MFTLFPTLPFSNEAPFLFGLSSDLVCCTVVSNVSLFNVSDISKTKVDNCHIVY
jgi:hypothetical protein